MEKYFSKISIIILLTAGAVIMGVFSLWPMFQELSRIEYKLEQYNMALAGREKYVSDLAVLGQRLDTKREAIRKIEIAIPDNTSIPALFDLLQNMSINSGLIVTEMTSFTKEDNPANLNIVVTVISLKTVGTYDTLKAFIAQAKSSARLLEITSISFGGRNATELPDPGQFQFILELETYED